jgi:hypothetical protein
MFMRFVGGGIGHKATDYIQQSTPVCVRDEAPDVQDEVIIPHDTHDHAREGGDDVDVDGDPEEVDIDEEVDYGYGDDLESEDKDSEGEEENDDDDEYEKL